MAIPQAQVTLTLTVLKQNGDRVPSGEVRCLQFMLAFVSGGYSPFERALRPSDGVDGLFGPDTDQRVRHFQASEHLAVDGEVGKNTWKALLDHWTTFEKAG